ncbi:SDR family oxidoreductase [Actinoplanes sp. NPDC023936]|uniref:SDR family oxidoreductase n=1 Tax=Actinoplanes sp. NPDC023936 TaxID=3154910 RepID=UPI0033DDF058
MRQHDHAASGDRPVTLITGGSTGIGAAVARQLLDRGHRVVVLARDQDRLDQFVAEADGPPELIAVQGDASDYDTVQETVQKAIATFGRLDNAVANAGFATHDNLATGDPGGWREMVLTNVLGPMLLIRATVEALRATRGRIVLVGSIVGQLHNRGNIYGATKWAIRGLAENARLLVAEDGIGVTLIAPGRVDTPFWEDSRRGAPSGPILSADQVAETIVWALSQAPGVDVNTIVVRPTGSPI